MTKRIKILVFLFLVSATLLAACGGNPGTPGIVPNSLQSIEAAAEDIIDIAPGGNWEKIAADVMTITDDWKTYAAQAGKDGATQATQDALSTALHQLETASVAKDPTATMQSANSLSAAVVELFAIYNPAIPADIGRLDVLERQVVLDVAVDDYAAASTSLASVRTVWENIQASVREHNGMGAAEQFEASLAAQENALIAKDEAILRDEVNVGLEIVDEFEKLY